MRAVLFDFGGTLDFPRHWLDRFLAHYRAVGIEIARDELAPAFTSATRKAYAQSSLLSHHSLSELVQYLVQLQFESLCVIGTPLTRNLLRMAAASGTTTELIAQIRGSFVAESVKGFAVNRPLLVSLARCRKIAVVSNFYGNLDRVLAQADLADAVDSIADSSRLGIYKPDPRIFAAALSSLGVDPRDAVMVGDSIEKDCLPARTMGMTTVWLRHREFRDRAVPPHAVDFTIDELEGLKEVV
jgi:FMN phosphatase YigB (HAD superfamily)